ncbi:MAG TPA: TIGR00341 family protein [Coleofasciculaceae cyanobacterium]
MLQPKVSKEELALLRESLHKEAQLSQNYVVLIVSSCLIATFGLISNSAAVIIGAMIIAPLMLPLRGLAFAALEGNINLFRNSLISIAIGTGISVLIAGLIGRLIGIPEFGSEVLSRTQPNLVDLGIAVTAGGVSGFAKVKPQIGDALAGTAIAVALMPPLCVVGLLLSQGDWRSGWGAFLLYLTNLLGITLACMTIFIINGYTRMNHAFGWTLGFTSLLLLPLGASFFQLVKQAQLKAMLKQTLVNRTITVGEQVQLLNTDVDWTANPPEVYLNVLANKPITPKQVRLVEEFIKKEMGQPFNIIIRVTEIEEVGGEDSLKPKKQDTIPNSK